MHCFPGKRPNASRSASCSAWRLEVRELQATIELEGRRQEEHYRSSILKIAAVEFAGGGDLESLGDKLVETAFVSPGIQALWLVDPQDQQVAQYQDRAFDSEGRPCFPLVEAHAGIAKDSRPWDMEHRPGEIGAGPMGCIKVPLPGGRGAVLMHTLRPWSEQGERAHTLLRNTALRLAPVFLVFYLLMSALLLMASRAVRVWRDRAEACSRTQALENLAVGLGHEIRNPLNTVALSFDYLARRANDEEVRRAVETARREAERIGSTLEEFVRYTAAAGLQVGSTSVAGLVRRAASEEPGSPELRLDGDARADLDADRMQTAFREILRFFGDQAADGEPLEVRLRGGRRWQVRFRGPAPRLDRDAEGQLFDLYLRSRPHDVERGLALARAVFQAHGGEMRARVNQGMLTIRGGAPTAVAMEGVR
ncbi:MAG: sensor histidine kinase [Planctomycetota bacterium]